MKENKTHYDAAPWIPAILDSKARNQISLARNKATRGLSESVLALFREKKCE